MTDMRRRFGAVKSAVISLVVDQDAFGLAGPSILKLNEDKQQYRFLTDADKVAEFRKWLKEQMDGKILTGDGRKGEKPWTNEYIGSAYKQGVMRAFMDARKEKLASMSGAHIEGGKAEFLRSSFGGPEATSKIELIYTRAFNSLKGVTDTMANDMSRILASGLADGKSPRDIARTMAKSIDGITNKRALTIARTEIIHAHAEGQLDSFEKLGVSTLGVAVEWSTAGDDKVCPRCAPMNGKTFTVQQARGQIPLHPNCRCAWIPGPIAPKKAPEVGADGWPIYSTLRDGQRLGGSTGATIARAPDGRVFVKKFGNSPEHVREEFAADQMYRAAGFDVPNAKLYTDEKGQPVKLAEFVKGETLDAFLNRATPAERDAVLAKIREGFAMDAFMGNYDVIGMSRDNILVDTKGNVWRIDNGGSLRYRAQGAKKASWGATLDEFKTMRDPKINPQAAAIFGSLTDADLKKQVEALLEKKDAVMAAAPADLKQVIENRFTLLTQMFPKATGGFTPELAKQVSDSRILGVPFLGDGDKVEDLQILFWTEKRGGEEHTVARFKLTPQGNAALKLKQGMSTSASAAPSDPYFSKLENAAMDVAVNAKKGSVSEATVEVLFDMELELKKEPNPMVKAYYHSVIGKLTSAINEKKAPDLPLSFQYTAPPQVDPYWPKLQLALKTVAVHASDGKYNPNVMSTFADLKNELAKEKHPLIKAHYQSVVDEIDAAVKEKRAPKMQSAFVAPAYKPTVAPAQSMALQQETWNMMVKSKQRGHAVADPAKTVYSVSSALRAQDPTTGVDARIILPDDSKAPYALRGTVEMAVKGKATPEQLKAIAKTAEALGINIEASSESQVQLTYLVKSLNILHKELTPAQRKAWQDIASNSSLSEAERVSKLRSYVVDTLKIVDPVNDIDKLAQGRANAYGMGWKVWERFDIPRARIEKDMKAYTLHHESKADLAVLTRAWLDGGGQVTPTTERLRTGVPINTGMSPSDDLETGGASYMFTRIYKHDTAKQTAGFTFKIGNLSRLDAVSFDRDMYGDVRPKPLNTHARGDFRDERGVTITEWESFATRGGNETIFKNGLHLLDDLDYIVARTETEKKGIIQAFKDHGYTQLPDGRKIEDVVTKRPW